MTRTAVSTHWDHTQIGSWGISPLPIKGAKTLIKRPRGLEYTILKGIIEAGSRPPQRQLSSTWQSVAPCHTDLPWPSATKGSAPLDWERILSNPWDPQDWLFPVIRRRTPFPLCCLSDLLAQTLGLGFISPIVCCVPVIYFLDCYSVIKTLMYVDVLLWVSLHLSK